MEVFRNSCHDNSDREFVLTDSPSPTEKPSDPSIMIQDVSKTDVYEPVPESAKMVLQWKNISVTVKPSHGYFRQKETLPAKQILSDVSGAAFPGTLLAIVGASGSGKTTLLNALTLRSQGHLDVQGKVLVSGVPVTPGEIDALSAYVQQEDLFYGKLTVREQLTFHLGLTPCQDTLIGVPGRIQGISGGERRRLSFAAEVLSDPPLMFCDEPTTGLDAAMAQNIILLLRKMAAKGKTVICTIHQPSSHLYILFDRIMIMTEGKLAFLGTPDEALHFFSSVHQPCPPNCCPADHFIHVLAALEDMNRESAAEAICKAFALTEARREAVAKQQLCIWEKKNWILSEEGLTELSCVASTGLQFCTVLWRSWLGVIRDTKIVVIKMLAYVLMALMVGTIYWNQRMDQMGVINVNSFLILFQLLLMAQNVFPTLHVLSEEMPLLRQENWNGMYSTGMYIICKSIADLPECTVFPFLQVVIMYNMIGIASDWHKVLFASGVIILVSNALVSFGCLMSSVNCSLGGAVALLPVMLGPLITTSGKFINMRFVPWYFHWVQYLSMFNFGSEALFVNQWQDVTHIDCNVNNSTCPRNGHDILRTTNSDPDNITLDITGLLALIVFYRMLAAVILSLQIRRKL